MSEYIVVVETVVGRFFVSSAGWARHEDGVLFSRLYDGEWMNSNKDFLFGLTESAVDIGYMTAKRKFDILSKS